MTRNLKVLGLAVSALLAISAAGALAVSAAEFHSKAEKTTLSGAQITTHAFTTDPGKVTCKVATVAGEQTSATASEIYLTPTYKECTISTIFGNIEAGIDFMGCYFKMKSDETLHILCPAGKGPVTVTGPGCSITFPAQTISGLTFSNTVGGWMRLLLNLSGIKYSYHGFTCGSGTETANGTYTGETTLGGSASIWWE